MRYRYTILTALILVSACGSTAAPAAKVSPSPSPDPQAVARFEGVYDIKYTITAMTGLAATEYSVKVGESETRVWTTTPRCASGPCDTDIQSSTPPSTTTAPSRINFAGGTYNLSETVIGSDCGNTTKNDAFDNAITISITPSTFVEVGKVLYVAQLTGTRHQVVKPRTNALMVGCAKTATYTYDVLGVRRS